MEFKRVHKPPSGQEKPGPRSKKKCTLLKRGRFPDILEFSSRCIPKRKKRDKGNSLQNTPETHEFPTMKRNRKLRNAGIAVGIAAATALAVFVCYESVRLSIGLVNHFSAEFKNFIRSMPPGPFSFWKDI